MGKELSEMTLEELWDLFPISLVKHDEQWKECFKEIESTIKDLLAGYPVKRISHIGSTAINGIWAKPIIDILVEIERNDDMDKATVLMQKNGFILMCKEQNRISLNLGYTENGFADRVYHLHLRYKGDNDELYFRDYLNEFPETAKSYERLKLDLWKRYEFDRDGYTAAKTEFIIRYTKGAKEKYENRYI